MTTTIEIVKILKMNTDGNVYSIPATLDGEFVRLDEALQTSEFGSDEWFAAHDEFNRTFDRYMKG